MLLGMKQFCYEERLKKPGFFPLEQRRLKRNIIEKYKMMRGMVRVDCQKSLPSSHEEDISLEQVPRDLMRTRGGTFFTMKLASVWNAVPEGVIEAASLKPFMKYLEENLNHIGLDHVLGNGVILHPLADTDM